MRRSPALVLPAAVLACALGAAGPADADAALGVHAVFSGGATASFHVGQPVQASAVGADRGDAVARVCWTPAPLGRPACTGGIAAPTQAGRQVVEATLASGAVRRASFVVRAARTRYDGRVAAFAHVTCVTTTAYTNIALRPGGPSFPLAAGTSVARYQRHGRGVAVWGYAAGRIGFVKAGCLAPGPA